MFTGIKSMCHLYILLKAHFIVLKTQLWVWIQCLVLLSHQDSENNISDIMLELTITCLAPG